MIRWEVAFGLCLLSGCLAIAWTKLMAWYCSKLPLPPIEEADDERLELMADQLHAEEVRRAAEHWMKNFGSDEHSLCDCQGCYELARMVEGKPSAPSLLNNRPSRFDVLVDRFRGDDD